SLNNSGQLSIQNAGNRAILNYGGIDNYGNMNIQYSNGGIFCWANGNVVNSGNLTVVGCNISILLRSNSVGINMHSGQMTLNHAALYAIKVESGNNFFNFGEINSTVGHNLMTICNQGFFHNNNSGSININIATTGMKNWENATFWNDGSVSFLSNMDNQTIWNEGEFVNFSCGELSTYFKWGNYATGTIENEGNWFHNASLSSLNFGQVTNNGVVEDYQGTFPSFSNNEVRARPLTGTLQVGGLVHNALDLGTLSSFTVDGWYTTAALTQSAGRYSTSHNIWQPNGHTSGLSEVFVSLLDNSGNCDVVVRVPIPGGITSFAVPTPSTTLIGEHINPIVYPIPNSGSFTVEMPNDDEGPSKLQLLDMSGRMLWQGAYQLDGPSPVKLPSLIASGVYQLVVRTNEKVMYAERIILER
ncbi:MAG: T9SS type A sorting domain-containing protein, partial [Phaeodactylibacter sp.]|nr:T9SS type A sorting domain-containing protein [Phaeodactylibacter sp.]